MQLIVGRNFVREFKWQNEYFMSWPVMRKQQLDTMLVRESEGVKCVVSHIIGEIRNLESGQ